MSYLDKELYKVPGPTKYFKAGHPLTTFTFENTELSPSILQGKNAPHYSIGKQDRGTFNRFVEKTNFGPGPAAYNSLSSLKTVIVRNKPKFQYYNEEGHNASVARRTIAAQQHVVEMLKKKEQRLKRTRRMSSPEVRVTGSNDLQRHATSKSMAFQLKSATNLASHQSNSRFSRNPMNFHTMPVGEHYNINGIPLALRPTIEHTITSGRSPNTAGRDLDQFQLQKQHRTLKTSKSVGATTPKAATAAGRHSRVKRKLTKQERDAVEDIVQAKSPSPGQYDNFKQFYDRSKHRSVTMGKKFDVGPKQDKVRPGPAAYDTRQRVFATQGGAGSSMGQQWSFGTEARTINKDVIRLASKVPAPTDYNPQRKKTEPQISFGQRLLDILSKRVVSPGPARYNAKYLDIQTRIRTKLQLSKPVGPPALKPRPF